MSEKQSGMHDNQEQQTEALSAYLDGALSGVGREALERHLATCDTCQAELADLRRVRALLRALPQPAAPRSFMLPVTGVPGQRRGAPDRAPVWTRATQWAGGIAAAVGIGLLTLGALHAPAATMGAAAPDRNASTTFGGENSATTTTAAPSADQATATSNAAHTPFAEGTHSTAGAGTAVTVATPTTASGAQAPAPVSVPGTESSGSPLLPAGATLLIGGGAALVVGTASRRKRRPREQAR